MAAPADFDSTQYWPETTPDQYYVLPSGEEKDEKDDARVLAAIPSGAGVWFVCGESACADARKHGRRVFRADEYPM